MRWEVCEWREPNIEDGAAIHNAQQQQQWRISLKNSKGRRGLERDVEVAEVVHLPAGWSPIQTTTSVRGVDAIIAIFSSQVVTNPNNNIL